LKNIFIIRLTPIDKSNYMLWHDRLEHPGHNTMFKTMIASHGHPLRGKNFVIKSEKLMPSLLYWKDKFQTNSCKAYRTLVS
jgi:hypothetical protein